MPSFPSAATAFLIRIVRFFIFFVFFVFFFFFVFDWKWIRFGNLSQIWKLGSFSRNYALLDKFFEFGTENVLQR